MSSNTDQKTVLLHEAISVAIDAFEIRDRIGDVGIPYIVGDPGGGKTKMIQSMVAERGYGCVSCEPALQRVEMFGGIPDIVKFKIDGKEELHTKWSVPELICTVREIARKFSKVVILFDDWHLCTPEIQQIGFELFTHHSLNNHVLPDNVMFVLAGNASSAAGARVALSAIRNRSSMIFAVSDPEYWVSNYAVPNSIHPAGIGFFMQPSNSALFHMKESTSSQFASPRSWTSAFNWLSFYEEKMKTGEITERRFKNLTSALIEGCVGREACAAFLQYYHIQSKFDTTEIYKTGNFTVPEEAVTAFAFGYAITSSFYDILTKKKTDEETVSKAHFKTAEKEKAAKIFGNIIKEMIANRKREIAMKLLNHVGNMKPNKKLGIEVKGQDIIDFMISCKALGASEIAIIAEIVKKI